MRYFCIQCFCNNPLVCRHVQRLLFVQCHPFDCIFAVTFCIFMNRSSQYLTLCILDDIQTVVNRSLIASYETTFQTETDLCINRSFANSCNTQRCGKVLQFNEQFRRNTLFINSIHLAIIQIYICIYSTILSNICDILPIFFRLFLIFITSFFHLNKQRVNRRLIREQELMLSIQQATFNLIFNVISPTKFQETNTSTISSSIDFQIQFFICF